jgi:transcriptional regulator with XRE-family HTH domain
MSELNERISSVVAMSGNTKTKFAEKINISQPYLSQLCSGAKLPSDRTIADICREFGVSETWLRTGAGEPFMPPSRSEEMGRLVKSLMADKPEAFRSRLITALLRFDADGPEWQLLENIYNSVAADVEKETGQ